MAIGSIPANGSSRRIKLGLDAKHLAISSRLLSPPDKDNDGAYLRCSIPNSANKSSSFFCFVSDDFSVFSNIERIFFFYIHSPKY